MDLELPLKLVFDCFIKIGKDSLFAPFPQLARAALQVAAERSKAGAFSGAACRKPLNGIDRSVWQNEPDTPRLFSGRDPPLGHFSWENFEGFLGGGGASRRTYFGQNRKAESTTTQKARPRKILEPGYERDEVGVLLLHVLKAGFLRPKVQRKARISPVPCKSTSSKKNRMSSIKKPAMKPMEQGWRRAFGQSAAFSMVF